MTHDFKKLFTDEKYFSPIFQMPEKDDLDSFFEEFYGHKRFMIADDTNYSKAREEVDKLCQFMNDLGLTKANGLKDKFSSINVSNAKEASNIKETMETIVYVLANQRENIQSQLISNYKDRQFSCGPGTLSNLQQIAEGLLIGGANLDVRIAKAKREVVQNIIQDMMRKNLFAPNFANSSGMEVHYILPLANAVANDFGLEKHDLSKDIYVANKQEAADKFKDIIVDAINHNFAENGIEIILNIALQEYIKFLPPIPHDLENLTQNENAAITSDLKSQMNIFGVAFHSGVLLEVDEDYNFKGYKSNLEEILEAVFRVAFDEKGLMKDENLEFHRQIIQIELSTEPALDKDTIGQMSEEIEQYLMQNDKLLDENDFDTKSIFEFLGEEKVRKFLQENEQIKGRNATIYTLQHLPEKFHPELSKEDLSKLLEKVQSFEDLDFLVSKGADITYVADGQEKGVVQKFIVRALRDKDMQSEAMKFIDKHVNLENYDKFVGIYYKDVYSDFTEELLVRLEKLSKNFFGKRIYSGYNEDLKRAALRGDKEIVKALIDRGVDFMHDENYNTFCIAAYRGHKDIIELFIDNGGEGIILRDGPIKWSILSAAASKGHIDIVEFLIDKAVDVNVKIAGANDALTRAARAGHKDVVELLLDKLGDDINKGAQALSNAAIKGHKDIVELLLDKRCKINFEGYSSNSALEGAIKYGHKDIVELLLNKKVNFDFEGEEGKKALISAANNGHNDIVELLMNKKASVNLIDEQGRNALISAAKFGMLGFVSSWIDRGGDVNVTDAAGDSALIMSMQNGHKDIAKLLIEKKADTTLINKSGKTAFCYAMQNDNNHEEMQNLLAPHFVAQAESKSNLFNKATSLILRAARLGKPSEYEKSLQKAHKLVAMQNKRSQDAEVKQIADGFVDIPEPPNVDPRQDNLARELERRQNNDNRDMGR